MHAYVSFQIRKLIAKTILDLMHTMTRMATREKLERRASGRVAFLLSRADSDPTALVVVRL